MRLNVCDRIRKLKKSYNVVLISQCW